MATTFDSETKTVTVRCVWESEHDIEVPADWTADGSLETVWASQVDAHTAELVDWTIR